MKKSWLTAASAFAAVAVDGTPATAQLFSAPSSVAFGDTLVGDTTSQNFNVIVLGTISSGNIPAAGAPFSGGGLSLAGLTKGDAAKLTFGFAPTQRGAASENLNASAVNLNTKTLQPEKITLSGTGVAPVESVSAGAAPFTRIGTTSNGTVSVTNVGDGNLSGLGSVSNLQGDVGGASGAFAGKGGPINLKDGASQGFNYSFAPTLHGVSTSLATATFSNGSADGTNQGATQNVTLTGIGVGPDYSSNVSPTNGVIQLGVLHQGASESFDLKISNFSKDPTGSDPTLTDLSLLSANIFAAGADAAKLSLSNFAPTVLTEGDSIDLKIDFSAQSLGLTKANLVIATDQNAAFGQSGETFTYALSADVVAGVPEAQTWEMLLLGFGALGLQIGWRRSSKSSADENGPTRQGA